MISTITFTHGARTCSPCQWQGMSGFGTRPICSLFNQTLYTAGGVGFCRCAQCLEKFGEGYTAQLALSWATFIRTLKNEQTTLKTSA